MQAAWPLLAYYLSVLGALGVGSVALVTGNSPVLAAIKAGAALLAFSTLGWGLNVVLFAAANSPAVRPAPPRSNDNLGPQDGPPSTDQTAGSERDEPA